MGTGWSIIERRPAPAAQLPIEQQLDILRTQRDGLARLQAQLLTTIRRLEAENERVKQQLERYQRYPSVEQQDDELTEARALEREHGLCFQHLPDDAYPGRPYVTQLDLIGRGITRYSRQNISRLTRATGSVPAMPIADRVLLPPRGVKALLQRERTAASDPSPRRRPGSGRANRSRTG
jgi:hypothetical protein